MFKFIQFRPMTLAWALAGAIVGAWFFENVIVIGAGAIVGLVVGVFLDYAERSHQRQA